MLERLLKEVVMKCTICKEGKPKKNMVLLSEAYLGIGSYEDYIVCKNCYVKIED